MSSSNIHTLALTQTICSLEKTREQIIPSSIEAIFNDARVIAITRTLRVDRQGYYQWIDADIIIKQENGFEILKKYHDVLSLGANTALAFLGLMMNEVHLGEIFLVEQWDEHNKNTDDHFMLKLVIMPDFLGLMIDDLEEYAEEFLMIIDSIFEQNLDKQEAQSEIKYAYGSCDFDPLGLFMITKNKSAHDTMSMMSKITKGLDLWKNILFHKSHYAQNISLRPKYPE